MTSQEPLYQASPPHTLASPPLELAMPSMPASPAPKATSAAAASSSILARGPTQTRRQQAAHRARILALSKQLTTRLQYATFKVEHGWSKQSLSEVENLYYRHRKGAASVAGPSTLSSGAHQSPLSARKSSVPSTPRLVGKPAPPKHASVGPESDVFGGLVTPPASGGTFPIHGESDFAFSGGASYASGLQRSPTAGLEAKASGAGSGAGSGPGAGHKGKSYADFWSKIGAPGPGQSTGRAASTERQHQP